MYRFCVSLPDAIYPAYEPKVLRMYVFQVANAVRCARSTLSSRVFVLALFALTSCGRVHTGMNDDDGVIPMETEIVMEPGTRITATTPNGTIVITAGKGLERSYTWENDTRSVKMMARKERWLGSRGLYFPGSGEHWRDHNGITRGVLEEGQQHFMTDADALRWIADQKWQPYVWRDDGLMVGWSKSHERNQLNVSVWQIIVAGKKPDKLNGSNNDKISIETQ